MTDRKQEIELQNSGHDIHEILEKYWFQRNGETVPIGKDWAESEEEEIEYEKDRVWANDGKPTGIKDDAEFYAIQRAVYKKVIMTVKGKKMAILTITKLLKEVLPDLNIKRVKLVRHKDSRKEQFIDGEPVKGNPYEWYIKDREKFIAYQSEQSEDRFKGVDYIVSFIGEEGTTARFVGVYKVLGIDEAKGRRINNGHLFYRMEEVPGFDEFNERVIIDWGKSAITWHQWLDKNDKEVIAIERKGIDWVCPDYEEILLPYERLKRIFEEGISVWRDKLSACNCIYVISDSNTGKLYVGSTYNSRGIWGRWEDYAKTGHGGDVELEKLLAEDPNYAKKYFTWAILQTLPLKIEDEKAIAVETRWKEKLGRTACALNRN